jgi:hypothetical protein
MLRHLIIAAITSANPTVLAALATAFAAVVISPFVSLLIAKRQIQAQLAVATSQIRAQTVSANRQAWINSLRDDLAEFLTLVLYTQPNIIAVYFAIGSQDQIMDAGRTFALVRMRIELKLSPGEEDHRRLIALTDRVVRDITKATKDMQGSLVMTEDATVSLSQVATTGDEILSLGRTILKREWERVKAGD